MENKLHFKISSATKSILGKDLIVDKNIAIFELVKNSYDACAENVDIYIDKDKITIIDNGDGMDINDLKNKWLFVGYSEKVQKDSKIKRTCKRRSFAGAKGIGRLACDRLGKKLKLTSIKNNKAEQIDVHWGDFEMDSKVDFSNINISHNSLSDKSYLGINKGTVLEISNLREDWNSYDVLKIKQHLTKLISPVKEDKDNFEIILHHENKKIAVENFIFEKLGLKTTEIKVEVSLDGTEIITELSDRGDNIYKVKEKNTWSDKISGIKIQLLYISRPTKLSFFHLTKERTVDYGSVFLYNNGFRVFPYGEFGDDSLGLSRRKEQGYARYLGNRELIGYIVIENGGDEFKETSSRDGGLLNTKGYKELKELFIEKALRRLEIYVVDTLNWTYNLKSETELFPEEKEEGIKELIEKLTKTKDFISLEYSFNLEKKIDKKINDEFKGASGILKKEAQKSGNTDLKKAVEKIEKIQTEQKILLEKQDIKLEKQDIKIVKKDEKIVKQEKKIEIKEEESAGLRNLLSNPFFKNIVDFHHDISIASGNIEGALAEALISIEEKNYEDLSNKLEIIKFENSKIFSISEIATRSGMKDGVHEKKMALNKKIISYLNDYRKMYSTMKININDKTKKDFIISFRYYDIVTILDNLLNNSLKHNSNNISVNIEENNNLLELSYLDDGNGLNKKFIDNPNNILKPKITTTSGAGWGLYQVNELLLEMEGGISVHPQKKGLLFKIYFKRGK